jgi:hypothetical protein
MRWNDDRGTALNKLYVLLVSSALILTHGTNSTPSMPAAVDGPSISRAESIALLHLCGKVLAPPSPNSISEDRVTKGTEYELSFHDELKLATTLAFLSSTRDDPDFITAVAIEESSNGSFNLLLCINRSRPSDGRDALREIKQGLESIIRTMVRQPSGECLSPDLPITGFILMA